MLLVDQIKKEIHKVSKSRKYHHKRRNRMDEFFSSIDAMESGNYISSYIIKGRTTGYVDTKKSRLMQRIVKPFKFGPERYKLELILESDFAICIDDKKVMVFKANNDFALMDENDPIFEGYTIDKETFFNLSLEYNCILTEKEIEEIRVLMRNKCENISLSIYKTPIISACLVPWKW